MSVRIITYGFEALHQTLPSRITDNQGDFLLSIVFAVMCEVGKRACTIWRPKLVKGDYVKLHEVVHKLIIRSLLTYYSISLCLSKDYFWDPTLLWAYKDGRIRDNGCTRISTPDERVYYVALFGYYLQHMLTQFNDAKRSDFWILVAHHIVTMILIMGSYTNGFTSIGILIATFHEPSDAFLSICKFCTYLGIKLGAEIFFFLLIISWAFLRIFLFPLKCLFPICHFWKFSLHAIIPIPLIEPHCRASFFINFMIYLMVVLYVMDIYWFVLILKGLKRKLMSGQIKDLRSDDEECSVDCSKNT